MESKAYQIFELLEATFELRRLEILYQTYHSGIVLRKLQLQRKTVDDLIKIVKPCIRERLTRLDIMEQIKMGFFPN